MRFPPRLLAQLMPDSRIGSSVRARSLVVIATVLAASIGLGGCTTATSSTAPHAATPTTAPTKTSALTALVPTYPKKLTAAVAKTNTVAAADAIQDLIAKTDIVNVDDRSQAVAATKSAGAYYGVLRAITVSKGFDVATQGEAMDKLLVAAGWTQRQDTNKSGIYAVLLSSSNAAGTSLLLLKADSTVPATPVIQLQLISPDLP
jgi:hypothetical protein